MIDIQNLIFIEFSTNNSYPLNQFKVGILSYETLNFKLSFKLSLHHTPYLMVQLRFKKFKVKNEGKK